MKRQKYIVFCATPTWSKPARVSAGHPFTDEGLVAAKRSANGLWDEWVLIFGHGDSATIEREYKVWITDPDGHTVYQLPTPREVALRERIAVLKAVDEEYKAQFKPYKTLPDTGEPDPNAEDREARAIVYALMCCVIPDYERELAGLADSREEQAG